MFHVCFQLHDLDHAVSAAYTYYVHNPKDEMMIENIKFYQTQPQFSEKMYKDLEEFDHQASFCLFLLKFILNVLQLFFSEVSSTRHRILRERRFYQCRCQFRTFARFLREIVRKLPITLH